MSCGNDDGDVTIRGLLGLVLVCVLLSIGDNTSMLCVWFAGVLCVWFAFVLGFDLFASDDAT